MVVLAAVLDAVWVGTTAARQLRAARNDLENGKAALIEGRLAEAQADFAQAGASAERAVDAMGHPTAVMGSKLPLIGDDVRAVRDLGVAADLSAQAGNLLVRAADAAGWHGSKAIVLSEGGPSPPSVLKAAAPDLDAAAKLMTQATATLSALSLDGLIAPVRDAVETARGTLGGGERAVRSAAALSHLLPTFLGGGETRRYLLVSLNLSDPRGSGGYPGTYGILRARAGRLALETLGPVSDLGTVRPVAAPRDVVNRYERFGALTHPIASTYSPDFPTSARLLLEMWKASGREPLDGVIALDSVMTSYLLDVTGPVQTPAWPAAITSANVSSVVNRDTFLTTSKTRSDRMQDAIGEELMRAVLARPLAPSALASILARATSERHLQIYSIDPREEVLLRQLGASGRLELGPNALVVAWDGASSSRAGYFAEKSIGYRAELQADGSARVTIRLTLRNTAPSGPPSILLGERGSGVPIGTYWALANTYLPTGAEEIRARVVSQASVNLVEREFGHPVVLQLLRTPSGGTVTSTITYRIPHALIPVGAVRRFAVDVVPQPALRPAAYSVEIVPPAGSSIEGVSPGVTIEDGSGHYQAAPQVRTPLWVDLTLPEQPD